MAVLRYKIYQIAEYGGHNKPPKPIEKKDVSNTHYVLPNGDIVYDNLNLLQDNRYFEVELIGFNE